MALNILLIARGQSLFGPSTPWGAFLAMGLLNNALPFSLLFWGQTQMTSGLAAILNATTQLFTAVVAHFFTSDEKLTGAKVMALAAGFAGVVFLVGPDFRAGARSGIAGQVACLGAALSYAFAGIYGRRFRTMGVAPLEAAAGQVTASTLLILPIMLIVDRPWLLPAPPPLEVWAALAGLSLLSTAMAYVLYFRILAAAGATNLLLVTFLIPVTAILLGAAFLGERPEPRHFLAMGFIAAGLALIDGRLWRLARPAK